MILKSRVEEVKKIRVGNESAYKVTMKDGGIIYREKAALHMDKKTYYDLGRPVYPDTLKPWVSLCD